MNNKQKAAFILNLFAVAAQIYASTICILDKGWLAFQYYTMDSNIFSAISSIFLIISLLSKKEVSAKIHNLRFYSTCCVTLTFIVVIVILVPLAGWHTFTDRLFRGTELWLHTVCPLLNIFSFIFLEKESLLDKKQPYFAIIPTLLYAIVAIALNLARVIEGPYEFLKVYDLGFLKSAMWMVILAVIVFGIAFGLKKANSIRK